MRDPSKPHAVSRSRACDITNSSRWRGFIHIASTGGPKSGRITHFRVHTAYKRELTCVWMAYFFPPFFRFGSGVTSQYSTPVGDPRPTISTNNRDGCEACTCPLQATQEQGVLGVDGRTRTKKHELKHSVTDKNSTGEFILREQNKIPQSP